MTSTERLDRSGTSKTCGTAAPPAVLFHPGRRPSESCADTRATVRSLHPRRGAPVGALPARSNLCRIHPRPECRRIVTGERSPLADREHASSRHRSHPDERCDPRDALPSATRAPASCPSHSHASGIQGPTWLASGSSRIAKTPVEPASVASRRCAAIREVRATQRGARSGLVPEPLSREWDPRPNAARQRIITARETPVEPASVASRRCAAIREVHATQRGARSGRVPEPLSRKCAPGPNAASQRASGIASRSVHRELDGLGARTPHADLSLRPCEPHARPTRAYTHFKYELSGSVSSTG